uniref:Integral membrane protein n=1 Tax=Pseudenhygromyxa salsuginis TaxID=442868 RepID=A0A3Q8I5Y1_9BACT|nr:hypothetical protein [Pseudenhygromyxa salsuginis]
MVIAFGLVLGVVLVLLSIAGTRYQSVRLARGGDAEIVTGLELRWWAAYLVLAALIYVGFALREGVGDWMPLELVGVVVYAAFAVAGLRLRKGWLIAVGWALHAAWDAGVHHDAPEGLVPAWYRWACLSYDWGAALYLLWRSRQMRTIASLDTK